MREVETGAERLLVSSSLRPSTGNEYGGSTYCFGHTLDGGACTTDTIFFVHQGVLHRVALDGGAPEALTPKIGGKLSGLTFHDRSVYCTVETPHSTFLARIPAHLPAQRAWPRKLAGGNELAASFLYDCTVTERNGTTWMAYHRWDAPHMSWDGGAIVLQRGVEGEEGEDGDVYNLIQDGDDACGHPLFSPSGDQMAFISERSGYMNLWVYRMPSAGEDHNRDKARPLVVDDTAEHSYTIWVAGRRCFAWLGEERIVYAANYSGEWSLHEVDVVSIHVPCILLFSWCLFIPALFASSLNFCVHLMYY